MTRNIEFSLGEFYHVLNRGSNKIDIFLSKSEYRRFQKLLYVCNNTEPIVFKTVQGLALDEIKRGEPLVDIGAYCLMSNHFHLILRERVGGGISLFMGKLLTAYSMYFNKMNNRTGTLFEGPFKATHADSDEYLKYLFSYIHLNPVKIIDSEWKENGLADLALAKQHLAEYPYSSYLDYVGNSREERIILNKSAFPEYFSSFKEFDEFINEWLNYPRPRLG